jgi:hypothetical protein
MRLIVLAMAACTTKDPGRDSTGPTKPDVDSGPDTDTDTDADADTDTDTDADTDLETGGSETGLAETGIETGTDTGTPPVRAMVAEGPVVLCAQPADRSARGAFERRAAPNAKTDGAYLTSAGLMAGDFNLDGYLDIVVPHEVEPFQFWAGDAATQFTDQGRGAFRDIDLPDAVGGAAADFDGDGDLDLAITRWLRPNALLRNDLTGFVDITAGTDLPLHALRSQSAAWGDFDRDGDLDLVFGNYGPTPERFDDPEMPPADPVELYRNDGGGRFTDVSALIPLEEIHEGYQFQTAWLDIDLDGYPELISVHDFGKVRPSRILKNNGGTSFTVDASNQFHPGFEGMGLAVGDFNGDGTPDFVQTSWRVLSLLESSRLPGSSLLDHLWIEFGPSRGLNVDVSGGCFGPETPARHQCYGWGVEAVDLDNDGDLDVPSTFGFWTTYNSTRRWQKDGLWLQGADGHFSDQAGDPFWGFDDDGAGRGLLAVDLNGDGWPDLAKRELEGASPLYLSRCGSESWTKIRLEDRSPNRFGIGARVRLWTGDQVQTRWLQAGGHSQYVSGPPELLFGLGSAESIDKLEVVFADGTKAVLPGPFASRRVLTVTRL